MTRSRGIHTAARWSTPALVVSEWLYRDRRSRDKNVDGALLAISQFFHLVVDGYSNPLTKRKEMMASLCATGIAGRVLNEISGHPPSVDDVMSSARNYLETVSKLLGHKPIRFAGPELILLRYFLSVLHEQGEQARQASRWR